MAAPGRSLEWRGARARRSGSGVHGGLCSLRARDPLRRRRRKLKRNNHFQNRMCRGASFRAGSCRGRPTAFLPGRNGWTAAGRDTSGAVPTPNVRSPEQSDDAVASCARALRGSARRPPTGHHGTVTAGTAARRRRGQCRRYPTGASDRPRHPSQRRSTHRRIRCYAPADASRVTVVTRNQHPAARSRLRASWLSLGRRHCRHP